jgi:TRAP-type C4-dicarboxylate transport system permease small subunit
MAPAQSWATIFSPTPIHHKDPLMIDWIYRLAKWTAIAGGVMLSALTLMVVASVAGRALIGVGLGPVPGDFELVEVGVGIAIFFFMPWCYLRGGHATVDLLYMHIPRWAQKTIDTLSDVLMLLVWLMLTWKLWDGLVEKKEYMETTFILQMPIWWGYALCFAGGVAGCVVYVARMLTLLGLAREPEGWAVQSNAGH